MFLDFLRESKFDMVSRYNVRLEIERKEYDTRLLRYIKSKVALEGINLESTMYSGYVLEYRTNNYAARKSIGKLERLMVHYNIRNLLGSHDENEFSRETLDRYYIESQNEQARIYQNAKEIIDNVIIEIKRVHNKGVD